MSHFLSEDLNDCCEILVQFFVPMIFQIINSKKRRTEKFKVAGDSVKRLQGDLKFGLLFNFSMVVYRII